MKHRFFRHILVTCIAMTLLFALSLPAYAEDYTATDTITNLYNSVTSGGTAPTFGYYSISSAEELNLLSAYTKANYNTSGVTFFLTQDVNLNDGVSFTFDKDTALVKVAKEGETPYWLGTGITGDDSGNNTSFDSVANVGGTIYTDENGTVGTATFTVTTWEPIGYSTMMTHYRFKGIFDGCNHTISGIYTNITSSWSNGGLFNEIENAEIKGINVNQSYIRANSSYAGTIAGSSYKSTIYGCESDAIVIANSAAGILGNSNRSEVSSCHSKSTCCGGGYSGGITAYSSYSTLENCCNTGDVYGTTWIGGIAGIINSTDELAYCFNTGTVKGSDKTGGIVGNCNGDISYCYNTGNIYSGSYAGGIIGIMGTSNELSYCYNTGNVESDGFGGGIAGNVGSTFDISFCYYDQQLCTLKGIANNDFTDMAEGLLTSQMLGDALKTGDGSEGWSTTSWVFTDGLYPQIMNLADMDASYVSVSPLLLNATTSGYETVKSVTNEFSFSTANDVIWTSSDDNAISIDQESGLATIIKRGADVFLTATKGNTSKTVRLHTTALQLSSDAGLDSVFAQTDEEVSGAGAENDPILWEITVPNNEDSFSPANITVATGASAVINQDDQTTEITQTLPLSLTAGETATVYITVTAEDGETSLLYKVEITRETASSGGDNDEDALAYVDGDPYEAGDTQKISRTKTSIIIDDKKLELILNAENNGSTITIPVTDGSSIISCVLTAQMIKDMAAKDFTLVIVTDFATYTLPAAAVNVDELAERFGNDVALSAIEVAITLVSTDEDTIAFLKNTVDGGGFSLIANAVEFSVTCTYQEETIDAIVYNDYVERTIMLPKTIDPNEITTAVVVNNDGSVRQVPTKIEAIEGVYYAIINSLTNSVYALISNDLTFSDVSGHWAEDVINDMASRKIIAGYTDGAFLPDGHITRAEFATMMVRALGLPLSVGEQDFTDIADDAWYSRYIATAMHYGLVEGYNSHTFGPNDPITREQAITITARAMAITNLAGDITAEDIVTALGNFTDGSSVSIYAQSSVATCIETNIITGRDGNTLAPQEKVTRAETTVMVQRLLQQSGLI